MNADIFILTVKELLSLLQLTEKWEAERIGDLPKVTVKIYGMDRN